MNKILLSITFLIPFLITSCEKKDEDDSNSNSSDDKTVTVKPTLVAKWTLVDQKTDTYVNGIYGSYTEAVNIKNTTLEYKSDDTFENIYDYDNRTTSVSSGNVTSTTPLSGITSGTYVFDDDSKTIEQVAFGWTTFYDVEFTATSLKVTSDSENGIVRVKTVSNYSR